MTYAREFPRGMAPDKAIQAVVETAVAYVDQLCAYNGLSHPEVHRQRLRLSEAVDAYCHRRESVEMSERDARPPLGLRPRYVVNQLRQQEILEAMQRYVHAGDVIPRHWLDELSELSNWLSVAPDPTPPL